MSQAARRCDKKKRRADQRGKATGGGVRRRVWCSAWASVGSGSRRRTQGVRALQSLDRGWLVAGSGREQVGNGTLVLSKFAVAAGAKRASSR